MVVINTFFQNRYYNWLVVKTQMKKKRISTKNPADIPTVKKMEANISATALAGARTSDARC